MEQHPIRLLKAEEIECRVSAVSEKGLSLLLYKDARVDPGRDLRALRLEEEPPVH